MWTKLCQQNVDFYNNHPTAHLVLLVTYGVVAGRVINKMLHKIADADSNTP